MSRELKIYEVRDSVSNVLIRKFYSDRGIDHVEELVISLLNCRLDEVTIIDTGKTQSGCAGCSGHS